MRTLILAQEDRQDLATNRKMELSIMQKKIEYVSEKLIKDELKVFERRTIPALEATISEKYKPYFSRSFLHSVSSTMWASLYISLYLTSSDFKRARPSFRQQICAIHDYRNLLRGIVDVPLRFFDETNYWACYSGVSTLLHEKARFQKTHEISEEFWKEIRVAHKENLPPEYYELYLDFVEEMTRALTEAAITMVSTQIQNIFPGQSERYRQSLEGVYGSGLDEHIVTAGEEPSQLKTTKVKFSL